MANAKELSLFEPQEALRVETEGIKLAGSKHRLIPYILQAIKPLEARLVLDGFAGTTRVSQALSQAGYRVISNDIAVWAKVFATCYLLNNKPASYYQPKIDYLNTLPGKNGWFTEHYGGAPNDGDATQADGKKKPWQIHNTRKLDAIREEIETISEDETEKAVLLTSLMLAMDRVDNTVGHYASYLRKWAPRAYHTMKMQVPNLILNDEAHQVFNDDIFEVVGSVKPDVAYYDPPYGSSNEKMPPSRIRYASYYHLWTTICLNDCPTVVGAANRREDVSDTTASSVFEEFRRDADGRYIVVAALEKLIQQTQARYILMSYSNEGRATRDEIVTMLESLSLEHRIIEVDHKRHVMGSMRWTNEWTENAIPRTREYLFLISRDGSPLPQSIQGQPEFGVLEK